MGYGLARALAFGGMGMIRLATGSLFDSGAEVLVNPVNTAGVSGAGLALEFKRRWPENHRAYAAVCRDGELRPGGVFVWDTATPKKPWLIINFPTKRHWRELSRIEDIVAGLRTLRQVIEIGSIGSIAIPALGCGLGGLLWSEVRAAIERELAGLPNVEILLYGPR